MERVRTRVLTQKCQIVKIASLTFAFTTDEKSEVLDFDWLSAEKSCEDEQLVARAMPSRHSDENDCSRVKEIPR